MPTYSYTCDACGKSFEREQRISEDPIKKCALCGKAKARRQISSGNFILKGSGWYSDGYGAAKSTAASSSSASSASSSSSSPASPTSTGDGGKSETKGKSASAAE